MILLKDLKLFKLYKKNAFFPFMTEDKLKRSLIYLISPNIESSIKMINSNLFYNKYFNAYYIEKDISFFITQESFLQSENDDVINESYLDGIINEAKSSPMQYENIVKNIIQELDNSGLNYIKEDDKITIVGDQECDVFLEDSNIMSNSRYNQILRQILYRERFRTPKEITPIYERIKSECPQIKKTYLYIEKYKDYNLFVDFYYYNESFFKNNYIEKEKGIYLYLELLSRFIKDERYTNYYLKHTFIPVDSWAQTLPDGVKITDYLSTINPLSVLSRIMRKNVELLKSMFPHQTFVFTGKNAYFKLVTDILDKKSYMKFDKFINILANDLEIPVEDMGDMISDDNKNSIVFDIINRLENGKMKIKINNLTGGDSIEQEEIISRIEGAASKANDVNEALDDLDDDVEFKELLIKLSAQQSNGVNINQTRLKRIENLNTELKNKTLNGIKLSEMMKDDSNEELPVMDLSKRIDSVNSEDWASLKYINLENSYDLDKDIVNIIKDLSTKSYPIGIRNIKCEDTSTSEDFKETYTVECEDSFGKRFQFKFDIPKFKDNKFLVIKGYDKLIIGQHMLLPISKTDSDTVQIVSNYNKIFIRRYGKKSDSVSDRLVKTIEKINDGSIKKLKGDCTIANGEFDLPYTYEYLGSVYNKLETKEFIIYFNQDEIRKKYNITNLKSNEIPIAYDKVNGTVIRCNKNDIADNIKQLLSNDEFDKIYNSTTKGKKYIYSCASILDAKIPLIVILAYNGGLTNILKKYNVDYQIVEKLDPVYKKDDKYDFIRFNDGFIVFSCNNNVNMLMNGLKDANTEAYSVGDIDSKQMWLEVLDSYGNRAKLSDGLENFYDCMIDHITKQILIYYQLPTEFNDILLYANDLLIDTSYLDHTNMNAYRYRSNEIVAAYAYKCISKAYTDYKDKVKKGYKNATLSMKQSVIIDELLMANTVGDASYGTALGELESLNTVATKGLSGMNAERAYKIDKRSYDKTMINNVALVTNFASNAGINRQMTIDANVDTIRGYIKVEPDRNKMSITKSFSIEEALTPLGASHNDPMRSAMDFIQTSKHQLRTKKSFPSLITNGADQALPYLVTNNFAFKAKDDGVVKERTDDYIIIEYKNGSNDFVDIRDNIRKNSDGGFYISLKLDSDLKVGDKVNKGDVVAYDKSSFSSEYGANDNLTYSMGVLTKVAIMSTEEGFEDSTIISKYLSKALTSYIDVKKDISMNKNAILLEIAEKGQYVQEGDTILVYQDAYDEEDVNILMKSLSDDVELISELGRFTIKAKANGYIKDIKVYRTCEEDELSESLKKLVDKVNKPIKKIKSTMKKYNIDYVHGLESTDKLPPIGKLKDCEDGVKVEIYLEYEDEMAVGDKLVDYSAIKGVVRTVYEEGEEPYSSYRKDEKIHSILCVASTLARMCAAPIIVGGINKVLIELDRHCKDIAGIKWKYLDQM